MRYYNNIIKLLLLHIAKHFPADFFSSVLRIRRWQDQVKTVGCT